MSSQGRRKHFQIEGAPTVAGQLGPWTARPVADNSARTYRTTRPVDALNTECLSRE